MSLYFTITNHLKEYSNGGLAATLEDRYYRPSSSLEPFWECLKCSFRAAPVADAKQAVARIERLTGVRLSESQTRRFMKSLGMKARKACSIPGKANPQLQFEFYTTTLLPKLEEAGRGERKIFFVDAAHFIMGAFNSLRIKLLRPQPHPYFLTCHPKLPRSYVQRIKLFCKI